MMDLTAAQLLALKNDIAADAVLGQLPRNDDTAAQIAAAYNALAAPDFMVWRTDAPVNDIFDAIDFSRFTPNAALDDASLTDALVVARRQAQLLAIQTKQINLQVMLFGQRSVNASKPKIRAALRDAVINLPAGNGGAVVSAGGTGGSTVLNACVRKATRAEKLFSSGAAQTGPVTANLLTFEGQISYRDVTAAWSA